MRLGVTWGLQQCQYWKSSELLGVELELTFSWEGVWKRVTAVKDLGTQLPLTLLFSDTVVFIVMKMVETCYSNLDFKYEWRLLELKFPDDMQ